MLLIGPCCACAVFGVCADEDFPRNEGTWVLFINMLPILLSTQLLETSLLLNVFHPIRKADSELPIEVGFPTFFFTLSNQKCTQRPILLERLEASD